MRLFALTAFACAVGIPALAHDFWLQPASFWIAPQSTVATSMKVGHGPDREAWGADLNRVLMIRSLGPTREVDHRPTLLASKAGQDVALTFSEAGAHVLVLQTTHAESTLPGLRFSDYAKLEGLTPALAIREKTGRSATPGREIYSRRAKVLMQVGPVKPGADARVTRPVGLSLELVPERNPYTLPANAPLPVRVLYEGKPLAGALVKLTNLNSDAKPVAEQLSDQSGRVSFRIPRSGQWLVNVIWTKPIVGNPRADFDTTFSSLTFGYPARRPS